MDNIRNAKKNDMYLEAIKRLKLLGIDERHLSLFMINREFIKTSVNHSEGIVRYAEITKEEKQMVQKWEREKNSIVYYMIQDEGAWPDGCKFSRYTLLYVNSYVKDYKMVKEDCIVKFGTVPAYVINMEEPDYSEYGEILFKNVNGLLINLS